MPRKRDFYLNPCPICTANWYMTSLSLNVCQKHQDWTVCICADCGRKCFSDGDNLCPPCKQVK